MNLSEAQAHNEALSEAKSKSRSEAQVETETVVGIVFENPDPPMATPNTIFQAKPVVTTVGTPTFNDSSSILGRTPISFEARTSSSEKTNPQQQAVSIPTIPNHGKVGKHILHSKTLEHLKNIKKSHSPGQG